MIAETIAHPSYEQTTEPWLPEMPSHWRMTRLKSLLGQRSEKGYPDEPLLAATQTKGVVRKDDYGSRTVVATKDLHLLKLVKRGDFVISLRSFQGGIEYARDQGIISPAYTVLYTHDQVMHGFLAALFKSRPFIGNLTLYVTGIRQGQNIDYEKLSRSYVPVPPPDEQAAIVRFLAEADRRINRLIRSKRRLIELLNEQKQAIIHRAVTRGLDPDVAMKESGVEWLGEIPDHWEFSRTKYVATIQTGLTLGKDTRGNATVDRPYLRVANVQSGHVSLRVVKTIAATAQDIASSSLRSGDVLVTEGGDIDKLGRGCVWNSEIEGCLHQNHVFAVRCDLDRIMPEFFAALTASQVGRRYFELTAKKTTNLASTNSTKLGCFPVLLPTLGEQEEILDGITERTSDLVGAIDRAQSEITLLHEYRTRLTADVVTGKLDVRAAAAELKDEWVDDETWTEADADDAFEDANDEDAAA